MIKSNKELNYFPEKLFIHYCFKKYLFIKRFLKFYTSKEHFRIATDARYVTYICCSFEKAT